MSAAFVPSVGLLTKLGSIIVHAEELTSPDGHRFDADAMKALLAEPEVKAWLAEMDRMALLPRKRSAR